MNFSSKAGPLKSIRVLEFAGLAPVPLAGMVLSDFGASVTRIDRTGSMNPDRLSRGKRSIAINLKSKTGIQLIEKLVQKSDVLIDTFRPGVMERMSLGPDRMMKINDRLIYSRLSGYGQKGDLSLKAGHDINYLALSGVLSMLGRKGEKPTPPINLLGDFGGGSLVCVTGILMAIIERNITGKGQIVDANITDGAAYLASFLHRSKDLFIWRGERGTNVLDTGAPFYDTYETKDGKYMAVGALEPQFYQRFVEGLGIPEEVGSQVDFDAWPKLKEKITQRFGTMTQEEWCQHFADKDACVTPVLELQDAPLYHKKMARESFIKNSIEGREFWEPKPSPNLSNFIPSNEPKPQPEVGQHTVEILLEAGCSRIDIDNYIKEGIVEQSVPHASL